MSETENYENADNIETPSTASEAREAPTASLFFGKFSLLKLFRKSPTTSIAGANEKGITFKVQPIGEERDGIGERPWDSVHFPTEKAVAYRDLIFARGLDGGCSGFY